MFKRFNGNIVPFADESTSTNRTVFGSETQSDDIDDNLNADFKKGWEIVGLNDNPTREDFNAMGYTLGYLTAYLYQNGIAEYNSEQVYKENSLCLGADGSIYQSLVNNNTGYALTDSSKWSNILGKNFPIDTIEQLKTISNIESVAVLGYYEKGDGGGGTFYWDATSTEADNGGTIIQATGVTTGRWKREYSGTINAKWFGAKGNNTDDDTVAIQNAMDYGKVVYLPKGSYKISSLQFKNDNTVLIGDGQKITSLNSTITSGSVFYNPNKTNTTRYYCGIKKLQITSSTTQKIIDWQSFQFGELDNIWIYGNTKTSQTALYLGAVWTTTECTYNNVSNLYIGNVQYGIYISDGANTNSFNNIRVQPGVSAFGYYILGTANGRVSNNVFTSCHCEYPANTVTGYYIGLGSDATTIIGARLESMKEAITISSSAKKTTLIGNYFSSNTVNVNNSGSNTLELENGKLILNENQNGNYDINLKTSVYPGSRLLFGHSAGGEHFYSNDAEKGTKQGVYGSTYAGGTKFGVGASGSYMESTGGKMAIGTSDSNPLILGTLGSARMKIQPNGAVNFVLLSSDPTGATEGDFYYNSTSKKLRFFNGTAWADV